MQKFSFCKKICEFLTYDGKKKPFMVQCTGVFMAIYACWKVAGHIDRNISQYEVYS